MERSLGSRWRTRARRRSRIVAAAALAALLGAGCSDDGGSGDGPPEPFQLYGGRPPSAAELATYPKALPADAFAREAGATAASTPASFVIPEEELPPVKAQGTATEQGYPGSCEVWSAGYAMGSYTANLANRKPIKDLANTVSTAFVYMTVLAEEREGCGVGTSPGFTLNYLTANTAPSLETVPYYPVCACPPGSEECLDAIDLSLSCANDPAFCTDLFLGSWSGIAEGSAQETLALIKTWIAARHVVQMTILVPWEFGAYTSGVFQVAEACPSPQPDNCANKDGFACIASEKEKSGCAQHGVAIVGYDDALGAIKIQNSFGPDWGEQGYMWMSYETFSDIYLAGTIAFAPPAGAGALVLARRSAAADEGFQWVERDGGETLTHLIFATTLERPLLLDEITLTSPTGRTVAHTYGHWFRSGHHYVTRRDGRLFESGRWKVRLEGTTAGPSPETVVLEDEVEVVALPGEDLPEAPLEGAITGTNGQPVR